MLKKKCLSLLLVLLFPYNNQKNIPIPNHLLKNWFTTINKDIDLNKYINPYSDTIIILTPQIQPLNQSSISLLKDTKHLISQLDPESLKPLEMVITLIDNILLFEQFHLNIQQLNQQLIAMIQNLNLKKEIPENDSFLTIFSSEKPTETIYKSLISYKNQIPTTPSYVTKIS